MEFFVVAFFLCSGGDLVLVSALPWIVIVRMWHLLQFLHSAVLAAPYCSEEIKHSVF
jgi:hypothetical protein